MLDIMDRKTATERMQKALENAGLDDSIDAEHISYWLDIDEGMGLGIDGALKVLSGLLSDLRTIKKQDIDSFTASLIDLHNSINYRKPQGEVAGREGLIEISKTRIPPDEWNEHYSRALDMLYSNRLLESSDEFEKVFEALLKEPTTSRDIFRIYYNASLAHLLGGRPDLGMACLNAAIALNPKYTIARKKLEEVNREDSKKMIELGVLNRIQRVYKEDRHLLDGKRYSRMSEKQLIDELEGIGVKVSPKKFVNTARKVASKNDLVKILLYSQIPEDSLDNDKAFMIGKALWGIYCPEELSVEEMMEYLDFMDQLVSGEDVPSFDEIDEHFRYIEDMIWKDGKGVVKIWSGFQEYISANRYALMRIFELYSGDMDNRERFLGLSEELFRRTSDPFWKITLLQMDGFLNNELAEELNRQYPRFYIHHINGFIHWRDKGDIAKAHSSILQAVDVVEKNRKDGEKYPWNAGSITSDMEHVYGLLDVFYKKFVVKGKRKDLLREGKKNTETLIRSRNEEMENAFSKIMQEHMMKNPAIRYLKLINELGIDFSTEEEAEAEVRDINPYHHTGRRKDKIGRNDPCPCGSGKRYKKCCLRYD